LFDMKNGWTKNAFWNVNNKKRRKFWRLFHHCDLITLMSYLCSQKTLNVKIKYFMFDWSIYNIFVKNRGWKRDSFQIVIFVYVCSTWSIVDLKTRFEMWITGYDVKGLFVSPSLFNNTYCLPVLTIGTKCPN
jgi:hypothetical protein